MTQKQQQGILQQITSTIINAHSLSLDINAKQTLSEEDSVAELSDLIEISSKVFNFGQCLPGTVHEKDFVINIKEDLPNPINLYVFILCEDPILNELPQFIFGIRRKSCYDYYDEFKFRVTKKGEYGFVIGAKAPNLSQHSIQCKMFVWMDGYSEEALEINLEMSIKLPTISCMKQLSGHSYRVIKLCSVKDKPKKQCRIPFRHHDNCTTSIQMEIIGLNQQQKSVIEVKPKLLNLTGKGQFFVTLVANFNEAIRKEVEEHPEGHSERRILVIKVKGSNCHFHFPVQATFYDSNKNNSQTD